MRKTKPDDYQELIEYCERSVRFHGTVWDDEGVIDLLSGAIFKHFNAGGGRNISGKMRSGGSQLPPHVKKEYGIARAKMNQSTWAMLNEEGRTDPLKSLEVAIDDALAGWKFEQQQDHILSGGYSSKVFSSFQLNAGWQCCATAQSRDGETIQIEQVAEFPLSNCTNCACRCMFIAQT